MAWARVREAVFEDPSGTRDPLAPEPGDKSPGYYHMSSGTRFWLANGSKLLVGSLKFRLWLAEAVPNVGMIYELRHYIPVPGKEAAILNRFKNHTFGIFKKNGFKTLNFWIDAKGSGQIWYVLVWESLSSMESSWERFRRDEEWIAAKEATEKGGPIVEKIESIPLTQSDDITAAIA